MRRLIVFTSIFGPKDTLHEIEEPALSPDIDYVCLTDQPFESATWRVIHVVPPFADSMSLSAKYFKMMPTFWLDDADYYMWVDGNVQICRPPTQLIDDAYDFIGFPIPWKYDRTLASPRFDYLRQFWPEDIPADLPVFSGKVIYRKMCKKMQSFDAAWFLGMYQAGTKPMEENTAFGHHLWQDEGWLAVKLHQMGIQARMLHPLEFHSCMRFHFHMVEGHPFG